MAANIRLAKVSATADWLQNVTMSGTSSMTIAATTFYRLAAVRSSLVGINMSGRGQMFVQTSATAFRLAGVSTQTTGNAAVFRLSGSGQLLLSLGTMFFRLARVDAYTPYADYTWSGSGWVISQTTGTPIPMVGSGSFTISSTGIGPTLGMAGVATLAIQPSSFIVVPGGLLTMDGVAGLAISNQSPINFGVVSMDGSSGLSVTLLGPTLIFFYTPPTYVIQRQLAGSLRYGIRVTTVMYRQASVWTNIQDAGVDSPVVASVDVDPSGIALYFDRPTQVPESLLTELLTNAITPADANWTPATLTAATQ